MKKVTRNANYTKRYNRNQVLRMLIEAPISRADLAKRTGLTPQAISNIVSSLQEEGLIKETMDSVPKMGRPPIYLELSDNIPIAVGIYLSRIECQIGIVNLDGKCIARENVDYDKKMTAHDKINMMISTIKNLLKKNGCGNEVLGIGICTPGPVDKQLGKILKPTDFEGWENIDIVSPFEKELKLHTSVENNAYAVASFEKNYGNGKGIDNFILCVVDSGIGCGVISNGRLFRGSHFLSGEIGHATIDMNGEKCSCGNIGCLEHYASTQNLLKRNGYQPDQWFLLTKQAIDGDKKALSIINQQAEYIVAGLISAVNMFDPEAVVLNGDILDVFDLIQQKISKELNERVISRHFGKIKILPSSREENHSVVVAANIIFDEYLSSGGIESK
jgi:hypothetical protein